MFYTSVPFIKFTGITLAFAERAPVSYSYAMCYSALVEQSVRKLAKGFRARIDEHAFMEIFMQRADAAEKLLEGDQSVKKITLAKSLEWEFLTEATTALGKQTKKEILRWQTLEERRLQTELQTQTERVKKAEASLQKKTTKKAENDLRIGTSKIGKAKYDLEDLRREPSERDSWIWPKYHFPGIITEKGRENERVIKPFRYLIRPNGQPIEFDDKYNGSYNAQQERLEEVFFWRELLGRHHGFFQVYRFKERQDEELMQSQKKLKLVTAPHPRKEYEFNPRRTMLVPFIWDQWHDPKRKYPDLLSAAAITCDPPTEVLKKGIRRLLTPLKEEHLDEWLEPHTEKRARYRQILADYHWDELQFSEVA